MSRLPSKSSARRVARRIAPSPAVAGFRPAGVALAVAAAFSMPLAHAGSVFLGNVHGSADIQRNGANMDVHTTNGHGKRTVLDWRSFNVPGGSKTWFYQPTGDSTSINRVTGGNLSEIFGKLGSNGRLVLVNPSGITIGQGAVIDTAGFTASTVGINDTDAIAGRLRFSEPGTGLLKLEGRTVVKQGDVFLIGARVESTADADFRNENGSIVLAAGRKVELTGRGLEGIVMEVQAGNEVVNLGALTGDAVGIFAGTLRHSGAITAHAVSTDGGKVVLKATGGDAIVDGRITARKGDKGGSIDVFGERVGLLADAHLQANGRLGGGSIRIGGDYQGANPDVPNAKRTYVDATARIEANATESGDGGRVIVWSDEVTRMHGKISARGGDEGGNGGFAEVSGKRYLEITEVVDLRAPKGAMGTLLLDPEDITIVAAAPRPPYSTDSTDSSDLGNTFPSPDDEVGTKFEPGSANPVTLTDARLNAQLTSANVRVMTSSSDFENNIGTGGMITVNSDAVIQWTTPNDLKLEADKGIRFLGSIQATGPGAVVHLHAKGGDIVGTGKIGVEALLVEAYEETSTSTHGGVISLTGANMVGTVAGVGSRVTLHNDQDLAVGSVSSAWRTVAVNGITSAGDVSLVTTAGDINLNQNVTANGTTSRVSLDAAGAINQVSTAVIQAPRLLVAAASASLNGPNQVGGVAAHISAGDFAFTNARTFTVDSLVSSDGATVSGISANGNVVLIAGEGSDININQDIRSGSTLYLESARGIKQEEETSVLQASNLIVTTGGGHATLDGANLVGRLAADVAGDFTLVNGQTLAIGAITPPFDDSLRADVVAAGRVQISTTSGNIGVAGHKVESTGSSISLTAAGGILGNGDFVTHGRRASTAPADPAALEGSVTLVATAGAVKYGTIRTRDDADGYSATPFAGNVTVTANTRIVGTGAIDAHGNPSSVGSEPGAMVTLSAKTGINVRDVSAGSAGRGAAGKVTMLTDAGNVRTGAIDVSTEAGTTGLPGGEVIVTASTGDVEVGRLNANGDYRSTTGGTGGKGGNVTITAGGEIVLTADGSGNAITANGGNGGTAPVIGGGEGGSITLTAGKGVRVGGVVDEEDVVSTDSSAAGTLSAKGGRGAGGGPGANGGTIRIERTDGNPLVMNDSLRLSVVGGQGGSGSGGSGGAGGKGGTVELVSAGRIDLLSPSILTAPGVGGSGESGPGARGLPGNFFARGTSVEVRGDFDLDAIWTNNSPVNLRGTSVVHGSGSFDNFGSVALHDTSQLAPEGGVLNNGVLTSFGADTLADLRINDGEVHIGAGSRLSATGFTSNAGVIQVDGTLAIGGFSAAPASTDCASCELQVAVTGPAFTNEASGTLTGNGNIIVAGGAGTLDNFGTIAPGTDGTVGTLSLTSNLVMEPGSTVRADLFSASSHDVINVSGTAVTGGAYAVTYQPGVSFSAGDVFSMLRAGALDATTLPTVNKPELTPATRANAFVLAAQAPPLDEAAIRQMRNESILFAERFLQDDIDRIGKDDIDRIGKDDIVVTDTACVPR